jgi:hypothetical protein
MNAPTATVLRGPSAVNEVRDLLDQLATVDELVMRCNGQGPEFDGSGEALASMIDITPEEVLEVIARRRAVITNTLENKGIRIAPAPDVAPLSNSEPGDLDEESK